MLPVLTPTVVSLDDPVAARPELVGAKAANLGRARAAGLPALPGIVLTTAWAPGDLDVAVDAWRDVSRDGGAAVVVRSSSTGEDGDGSSMAGVFESILGVADERAFVDAVRSVLDSAARARLAGLVDADMAVLVQPMLTARWGGVLFGADPITGRRDRLVVAAVPDGPDRLVSGEIDGWTAVLDRRGRVREVRSAPGTVAPPAELRRRLARLAATAAATYGGPQDVEWAVDHDGELHLLQARPITTLPPTTGTVYGPGPVAESFPDALSRLEQDLWLGPLRDGLREALMLTGTTAPRRLRATPLVIAVDGLAAADLAAIGADGARPGLLRRLDPRPPARRLRAAWRVGRLRHALPQLATDLVHQVDDDLAAVPELDTLTDRQLLAVLHNGRRMLVSLHGHEALTGLLIPAAEAATVTGASLALAAVARARAEGVAAGELTEHDPVVLALVPPRVGPPVELDLPAFGLPGGASPIDDLDVEAPDPAAIVREALRLRVRWVQELTGRAAWELARRLADRAALADQEHIRHLDVETLEAAVRRRVAIADTVGARPIEAAGATRSLPARFRLDADGQPHSVPAPRRRRRRGGSADAAIGAGGGVATGPATIGATDEVPAGAVLVVAHLDPRLAATIPRLAGLVAETGNPLSHLAILAREHGVATVVGLADATTRFRAGDVLTVDGHAGTVTASPDAPDASADSADATTSSHPRSADTRTAFPAEVAA